MSKQEDTAITEDIPVAYEVSDTSEAVPADIITIQNIDSKYIVISDNSRKIKILVSIQGIFNLVFTILIYHLYIISVILCYLGFLGAKKYKYKLILFYFKNMGNACCSGGEDKAGNVEVRDKKLNQKFTAR